MVSWALWTIHTRPLSTCSLHLWMRQTIHNEKGNSQCDCRELWVLQRKVKWQGLNILQSMVRVCLRAWHVSRDHFCGCSRQREKTGRTRAWPNWRLVRPRWLEWNGPEEECGEGQQEPDCNVLTTVWSPLHSRVIWLAFHTKNTILVAGWRMDDGSWCSVRCVLQ